MEMSGWFKALLTVTVPSVALIAFTAAVINGPPFEKNESKSAKLIRDFGTNFDIDVILPGESTPAFRLLAPEAIYGDGMEKVGGVHMRPATWTESGDELEGTLKLGEAVECALRLKPTADGTLMRITIKNTSEDTYKDVRLDICANLCRLPRSHKVEWSNRDFIPESVPLDRTQHGKHWYSVVTPTKLKAWRPGKGWVIMHERPDNPEPDPNNPYWRVVSETDDSFGCAVMSQDGKKLFYQVWRAERSHHQSPFAGNACMHLKPQIAKTLAPGQVATIQGKAGIFEGTWEQMAAEFEKFVQVEEE